MTEQFILNIIDKLIWNNHRALNSKHSPDTSQNLYSIYFLFRYCLQLIEWPPYLSYCYFYQGVHCWAFQRQYNNRCFRMPIDTFISFYIGNKHKIMPVLHILQVIYIVQIAQTKQRLFTLTYCSSGEFSEYKATKTIFQIFV